MQPNKGEKMTKREEWEAVRFIRSLLKQERQRIVGEIEGLVDRVTDPMSRGIDVESLGERIIAWLEFDLKEREK